MADASERSPTGNGTLDIKPEIVARIVFGARQLFADEEIREALRGMDDGELVQNEQIDIDDESLYQARHQEHEHNPVYNDLQSLINGLPVDHQVDLIALAWLGRGDTVIDEWPDLIDLARERRSDRTADYLLNMPQLAEHLQDGLEQFGHSVEDFEAE